MNKLLLIPVFALCSFGVSAQQYWSKIFQLYEQEYDESHQVLAEADRIIVAGDTEDTLTGYDEVLIRELDINGNLINLHGYELPSASAIAGGFANALVVHQDSGYIWTKYAGWSEIYIRLDNDLDTIFTKPIDSPIDPAHFFALDMLIPDQNSDDYFAVGRSDFEEGGGEILLRIDADGDVLEYFDDVVSPSLTDWMTSFHQMEDSNLLMAGYVNEYNDNFFPPLEYDAYVGKFNSIGENIWQHQFGHPDYNDDHGVAIELPDQSVALYYIHTDSIGSMDAPWSTRGTMKRININPDGEVSDTIIYYDQLKGAAFYDVQIHDNKVYALGQLWGNYAFFEKGFLLVTDLNGVELNYTEYYHLQCAECENYLYDLDIAPNGDVAMVGYVELDTLNYGFTHKTWVVKTDCMGRFEPPPLSFSASLIQVEDSLFGQIESEGYLEYYWSINGVVVSTADSLFNTLEEPGEYIVTATGKYCTVETDTSFSILITDCMGNTSIPDLEISTEVIQLNDTSFTFSASAEYLQDMFWVINQEILTGNFIQYNFSDTGIYIIEVCGNYCDSTHCEWFEMDVTTGVYNESNSEFNWKIYPNPVSNILSIDLISENFYEPVEITVFDAEGKCIFSEKRVHLYPVIINCQQFNPGLYSVHLETASRSQHVPFIILH